MARVTIEDCLKIVPDRFKLIEKAAARARAISEDGAPILVDRKNNRDVVVALREIAAGYTEFNKNSLFEEIDLVDKDTAVDSVASSASDK